ncbi:MAG TPA: hypothetical protein VLG09_00440 [Candidatus Saccharimonadales bacterium]|nr:hypothetical protein [Candidatus Saccharimonadales bacterium]
MNATPDTAIAVPGSSCRVTIVCRPSEGRVTVIAGLTLEDNSRRLTSDEMKDLRTAVNEIAGDRLDVLPQGSTEYYLTGDAATEMTEADLRAIFAGLPNLFVVGEVEVY